MKRLTTTAQVIDALGGNPALAEYAGVVHTAVSNWRKTKFPAHTYVWLRRLMKRRRIEAPDGLWAMSEPRGQQR